jgi:two-component system, OmpR family, KDP operon response regulator KdpE
VVAPHDARRQRRVLVIDDEPQTLRVLKATLTAHSYRTDLAAGGHEGLAAAAQCQPDIVIVDLGLPDMNGIEVIRSLRRWRHVPVIVLSASVASSDQVTALDAGADDYISKPFDVAELMARLRAALRRAGQFGIASRVRIGSRTVDIARHTVTGPQGDVSLTPTEWQVLEALVRRPGRLVSQAQLLAEVPGKAHVRGSSYLRAHLMHLRQKLEADPAAPRHLLTEPGMGFRFTP